MAQRTRSLILCAWTLAAATLAAQTADSPAFEVVSVKRNVSGDQRSSSIVQPGGRYSATNMTLRMLVKTAYGVHDDQIVGGQWARTHGFRDRGLQLHILGLFCGRLGEFVAHSHGAERYHSREDDDDQEDSFKASVDHDRLGFARHELAPGNPLREGRIGTAASICINASDRPLRS